MGNQVNHKVFVFKKLPFGTNIYAEQSIREAKNVQCLDDRLFTRLGLVFSPSLRLVLVKSFLKVSLAKPFFETRSSRVNFSLALETCNPDLLTINVQQTLILKSKHVL